jgi:hypothetical protein
LRLLRLLLLTFCAYLTMTVGCLVLSHTLP